MENVAIVLAAGSGKRMNSAVKKQYIEIEDKPVLYYTLTAFEHSALIDGIVLVVGADDIDYCRQEIVNRYGFAKVCEIVVGGKERYHSVRAGLRAIEMAGGCKNVLIHDGARPFVDDAMLERLLEGVKSHGACIAAVKSKDTVKIADDADYVVSTPNRGNVWNVQTPQVFDFALICDAHAALEREEATLKERNVEVTDDAMVVETWTGHKVKLIEGSYQNIKITTPEDIVIAKSIIMQCEANC